MGHNFSTLHHTATPPLLALHVPPPHTHTLHTLSLSSHTHCTSPTPVPPIPPPTSHTLHLSITTCLTPHCLSVTFPPSAGSTHTSPFYPCTHTHTTLHVCACCPLQTDWTGSGGFGSSSAVPGSSLHTMHTHTSTTHTPGSDPHCFPSGMLIGQDPPRVKPVNPIPAPFFPIFLFLALFHLRVREFFFFFALRACTTAFLSLAP